jgi:murein DD-endopeptidase MepM/ murein hydrolase activator NlpD
VASGGDLLGRLLKSTLRLFPERQILVRAEGRVSYIMLSRRAQLAMAFGGVAAIALVAYGLMGHPPRGAAQSATLAAALQAQVEALQRQLGAANARQVNDAAAEIAQSKAAVDEAQARIQALEEARDRATAQETELQRQLAQAQEAASSRSQNMAQLNRTLDANRGELRQSDAQRQALQARVHQLETELESANVRTNQAKADLASNERKLQQLAAEHDKTLAERDRLQARLLQLQDGGSPLAPVAPSTPQRSIADRPADQHSDNAPIPGAGNGSSSGELERVLASTGLDLERLIGGLNSVPQGEGGPFIALDPQSLMAREARAKQLRKILATLPLAAPLVHYTIGSGFGPRIDPFNHREEFHPGVDLEAAYRSPVYSTAPGTVIFTGAKGEYGKVVEISHGHGIVTRYAHLHRILVVRGEKVGAHHVIGQLGSTGRSTGPHLHYEVLVDGTALDPEKFLQAGKNNVVQANAR